MVDEIPQITHSEFAMRMAISCLCGALVGLEREWRDRAAGLRTHMLVTLGSTIFTLISLYGAQEWIIYSEQAAGTRPLFTTDPGRISAQIVSGIGFIGAGAIWKSKNSVHGVTTAASLWVMAAIGMAVGIGWIWESLLSTAGILVVLLALRLVGRKIRETKQHACLIVHMRIASAQVSHDILEALKQSKLTANKVELSQASPDATERSLTCTVEDVDDNAPQLVMKKLASLEGVNSIDVELRD